MKNRKYFLMAGAAMLAIITAVFTGQYFAPLSGNGRKAIDARLVAHALGGIDHRNYVNCLECFEHSYQRGVRYFEMDFMESSNGELAGIHDEFEQDLGLTKPFSIQQFRDVRLLGKYTSMDVPRLADLMLRVNDWYLITDMKSDNLKDLQTLAGGLQVRGVDFRKRIIPQIYGFEELHTVAGLGFERVVLTLYKMKVVDFPAVLQFVQAHQIISAVAMWNYLFTPEIGEQLKKMGVQTFVHTVNNADKACAFFKRGVAGVYTDFLFDSPAAYTDSAGILDLRCN